MYYVVQSRNSTIVMIGCPHRLTAGGNDAQAVGECGLLLGSDEASYVPWGVLSFEFLPIVSISRNRRLAHFAILEKKDTVVNGIKIVATYYPRNS